jgi:hypothetical protein
LKVTATTCCGQRQIQILWGLKLIQLLGPPSRKRIQGYAYKIRYKSEYSLMAPPKALEEAHASEGL